MVSILTEEPMRCWVLQALQERPEWRPKLLAIRVASLEAERRDIPLYDVGLEEVQQELESTHLPLLRREGWIDYTRGQSVELAINPEKLDTVLEQADLEESPALFPLVGLGGPPQGRTISPGRVSQFVDDVVCYLDDALRYSDEVLRWSDEVVTYCDEALRIVLDTNPFGYVVPL